MLNFNDTVKTVSGSMVVAACLVGCGGTGTTATTGGTGTTATTGGTGSTVTTGGTGTTNTTTHTPAVINRNLQRAEDATLAALNKHRQTCNFGKLAANSALNVSAANHADYLAWVTKSNYYLKLRSPLKKRYHNKKSSQRE